MTQGSASRKDVEDLAHKLLFADERLSGVLGDGADSPLNLSRAPSPSPSDDSSLVRRALLTL